ncbi:hypothetical protein Bca101_051828 [Brassica carinata]
MPTTPVTATRGSTKQLARHTQSQHETSGSVNWYFRHEFKLNLLVIRHKFAIDSLIVRHEFTKTRLWLGMSL